MITNVKEMVMLVYSTSYMQQGSDISNGKLGALCVMLSKMCQLFTLMSTLQEKNHHNNLPFDMFLT